MTDFKVKTELLINISGDLKDIQHSLGDFSLEIRRVASALDFRLAAAGMLRLKLNTIANSIFGCATRAGRISDSADKIGAVYTNTENSIASGHAGDSSDFTNDENFGLDDIFEKTPNLELIKDVINGDLVDAFKDYVGRLSSDEWVNLLKGVVDFPTGLPFVTGISVIVDIISGNTTVSTWANLVKSAGTVATKIKHPYVIAGGYVAIGVGSAINQAPEYIDELQAVHSNVIERISAGDYSGALFEGVVGVGRETYEYRLETVFDFLDTLYPITASIDMFELQSGYEVDGLFTGATAKVENFFDEITNIDNLRDWGAGLADMIGL